MIERTYETFLSSQIESRIFLQFHHLIICVSCVFFWNTVNRKHVRIIYGFYVLHFILGNVKDEGEGLNTEKNQREKKNP